MTNGPSGVQDVIIEIYHVIETSPSGPLVPVRSQLGIGYPCVLLPLPVCYQGVEVSAEGVSPAVELLHLDALFHPLALSGPLLQGGEYCLEYTLGPFVSDVLDGSFGGYLHGEDTLHIGVALL